MTKKAICFGEVLWDILPTQRVAGGAPMNVAIRLQSLGIQTQIISKIGKDIQGKELLSIIQSKNVDTSLIQNDEQLNTGEVLVKLDKNGIATYDIVYPVAWDKIIISEKHAEAIKNSEAFVFGSLVCRDKISRNTLFYLLDFATFKVFDVNIRKPFYDIKLIEEIMVKADFIKLNNEELAEIAMELGSKTKNLFENIQFISKKTNTGFICVTKGKDGAVLFVENQIYTNNGYHVKVEDTVGAGDSFLGALLSKILYSKDYDNALKYACAVGALVAQHKGANPDISNEEIENILGQDKIKN